MNGAGRASDAAAYLKGRLEGEVACRDVVLEKYATDGSLYRVRPMVVAFPRHAGDVAAAVAAAAHLGIPVTPRCAGTNLSGNAVGPGLVLDFSRNMTRILEPAREGDDWFVTTEPGVIKGELDAFLAGHGLRLPPDPSSAEICMLGGNVATKASGARSMAYGSMDDWLAGLEFVGADGRLVSTLDGPARGLAEEAARELAALAADLQADRATLDLLAAKRRLKVASGYNLRALLDHEGTGPVVTHLMPASVGTLGVFTLLKFRLAPQVEGRASVAAYFRDLRQAAEAVPSLREMGAVAIELMDDRTLSIVRRKDPELPIPPPPANLLLIEFEGPASVGAAERCRDLLAERYDLAVAEVETSAAGQERLWQVRKAIVPILSTWGGGLRPEAFIEDVAVETGSLPDLIGELTPIFERRGLVTGIYGHIGDGNLHIRPLLDLNDPAHRDLLEPLAREVYEAVFRYGGTTTAEHALGRVRAPFLEAEWGEAVVGYMRRLKKIFDPDDRLNPGTVFAEGSMTEHLKYPRAAVGPHDEPCIDCGYCNAVCPVSRALGGEEGARSWIHAARWRRLPGQPEESLREAERDLSDCLGCGRCEIRCPSGASVRRLLREERAAAPGRFSRTGPVLGALAYLPEGFFGLGRLAAATAPLWQGGSVAQVVRQAAGLDPAFVGPFRERDVFRFIPALQKPPAAPRLTVGLFVGCGHALLNDGVVETAITLLQRLNIRVVVPAQWCCGLPMDHYGYREEARALVRKNVAFFDEHRLDAVVATCATCVHMLRDYGNYLPERDPLKGAAGEFAARVRDPAELLLEQRILPGRPLKRRVAYHVPCHLVLAGAKEKTLELLGSAVEDPVLLPEGCCGGAGAYALLKGDLSRRIAEQRLRPLQEAKAGAVYTSCPGCWHQYASHLRRLGRPEKSLHLVHLLNEAY